MAGRDRRSLEAVYANTEIVARDGEVVDLTRPIGERERGLLRGLGLPPRFAILSAWPPAGEREDAIAGQLGTNRLRALAGLFGVPSQLVLARERGGDHRELSVAAALDLGTALRLARFFDQDALFTFDGDAFAIEWSDGRPPTPLPLAR